MRYPHRSSSILGAAALICVALGSAAWAAENAGSPAAQPKEPKLRIVVFGAHPDDPEIRAGGVAALWSQRGHAVKLVSVTNGDAGHWTTSREALAQRRKAEAAAADKLLGAASEVLDIHDGELEPTLENRRRMTRIIRDWKADIVIGHRPNDYHPDHRYVGILMQDSAFMVTVPLFCPDTPALKNNPTFLYCHDYFQRPKPDRYAPCPCGSGRKYKFCCGARK